MNNERRRRLANAVEKIADAKTIIEEVLDEEQEAFDSIPESLQASGPGETSQNAIDNLEQVDLDDAISTIEEAAQ